MYFKHFLLLNLVVSTSFTFSISFIQYFSLSIKPLIFHWLLGRWRPYYLIYRDKEDDPCWFLVPVIYILFVFWLFTSLLPSGRSLESWVLCCGCVTIQGKKNEVLGIWTSTSSVVRSCGCLYVGFFSTRLLSWSVGSFSFWKSIIIEIRSICGVSVLKVGVVGVNVPGGTSSQSLLIYSSDLNMGVDRHGSVGEGGMTPSQSRPDHL